MNDQRIEGTLNDTKGKVKEGVGNLTDDERLQNEGQADQLQGKVQQGIGDLQLEGDGGEPLRERVVDLAREAVALLGRRQVAAARVEARVLDRQRGGIGDRLQQPRLRVGEVVVIAHGGDDHQAERAPLGDQRHRQP